MSTIRVQSNDEASDHEHQQHSTPDQDKAKTEAYHAMTTYKHKDTASPECFTYHQAYERNTRGASSAWSERYTYNTQKPNSQRSGAVSGGNRESQETTVYTMKYMIHSVEVSRPRCGKAHMDAAADSP